MKKLFKFILPLLMLLSSCGSTSLTKETTIILDVESNVVPTFTANFGEGKYENKTYTHHISYYKDLYIYMSYEGLATETVYIPASEMTSSTIRKNVTFGKDLKSKIAVTAEYIDDISKATVETNNKLLNTKYFDKRKKVVEFTFEGRKEDIDITFKLDGYKDTLVHINKENLEAGLYSAKAMFLKTDQQAVIVQGDYDVSLYDADTSNYITSIGGKYSSGSGAYIIDTNKSYYVRYYDNNLLGYVNLKVDNETGLTVDTGSEAIRYTGRPLFYVSGFYDKNNKDFYIGGYRALFINKKKGFITTDYNIYENPSDYGVLFGVNDYESPDVDKVYYLEDFNSLARDVVTLDNYSSAKVYTSIEDIKALPLVNLKFNLHNYFNYDDIFDIWTAIIDFDGNYRDYVFRDNSFYIETVSLPYGYLDFEAYDQHDVVIYSERVYLINGLDGIDKMLDIDGKKVPLFSHLYLNKFDYDKSTYRYTYKEKVVIDTSLNYVTLVNTDVTDNPEVLNNISSIKKSSGEDAKYIASKYIIPTLGESYVIRMQDGRSFNYTPSELDLKSGVAYLGNKKLDFSFRVNEGLSYTLTNATSTYYNSLYEYTKDGIHYYRPYPNERGQYSEMYFTLSIKKCEDLIGEYYFRNRVYDYAGKDIDATPYLKHGFTNYVTDNPGITYETMNQQTIIVYGAYKDNDAMLKATNINDANDVLKVTKNDFVYDPALGIYRLKDDFNYVVIDAEYNVKYNITFDKPIYRYESYVDNIFVVSKDAVVTYKENSYNLADYPYTYLTFSGDDTTLTITPTDIKDRFLR